MKASPWRISKEGTNYSILRGEISEGKSKIVRLKVSDCSRYKQLRNGFKKGLSSKKDFEVLISKLNDQHTTASHAQHEEFSHFEEWFNGRTDIKEYVSQTLGHLRNHCFPFFIELRNCKSYKKWNGDSYQDEFLNYLIQKNLSVSSIESVREALNNYIKFKCYNDSSKGTFKSYRVSLPLLTRKKKTSITQRLDEAKSELQLAKSMKQFISTSHLKMILKNCGDENLKLVILLCYHFGLRPSEALAVSQQSFKKGWLLITKQQKTSGVLSNLKGVSYRKVPYFNIDQGTKFLIIGLFEQCKLDELDSKKISSAFINLNKALGLSYSLKDLRGTWITNGLDLIGKEFQVNTELDTITAQRVQMASGHVSINTTFLYQRDPYTDESANEVLILGAS